MDDHIKSMDQNTSKMASEIQKDNQYIKTLSDQSQQMSQSMAELSKSLAELEQMSSTLFQSVIEKLFTPKPPAQTPDINDILNGKIKQPDGKHS